MMGKIKKGNKNSKNKTRSAKSVKRKFADGGDVNKKDDIMDENTQLQDNNSNNVEGVPPHSSVTPQQTPVPTPEPVLTPVTPPNPPAPVETPAPQESVVEEIKEEVKPVENNLKEVEKEVVEESKGGKYILSFFLGAVAALAFGGTVKWNK